MFFFSLSFLDKVKTEEIVNHDLDNYTCHWLYFCIHHTINTRFRIYITVSIKNKTSKSKDDIDEFLNICYSSLDSV